MLLAKEANINSTTQEGDTALHMAAIFGQREIATLLVDLDALNTINVKRSSALHAAAQFGHKPIVQLLLDKYNNINETDLQGNTPLHRATSFGHTETVQLLIARGANTNIKNIDGFTPLDIANQKGLTKIAQILLEKEVTSQPKIASSADSQMISIKKPSAPKTSISQSSSKQINKNLEQSSIKPSKPYPSAASAASIQTNFK